MLLRFSREEKGFTLIELLVVIIVIAILTAVAIPLFLDQRKLAVDASVKSDVHNTSQAVLNWINSHDNTPVASTTDYKNAGGKVTQSTGNTMNVVVNANGAYTVCAYNANGKVLTANTKAFLFDSATGQFTNSTAGCPGDGATPSTLAPTITSGTVLPDGTTATDYSFNVTASGNPAPTFTATGLPAGLAINATTGLISGQPTAAGSFTVVIKVENSKGSDTRSYPLSISVKQSAPTITSSNLPGSATTGTDYNATVTANGYPAPTFSATGLPTGLAIDATSGVISGKPTAEGTFNVVVKAENSKGSNTQASTVTVTARPVVTTTSLPDAVVGSAYDYTVTATGTPTLSYNASNLPAGLSINGSTGRITGTPTSVPASQDVVITVSNANNTSKTLQLKTSTWTYCADENGTCSFTGTYQVRYGANSTYAYKTFTNGTPCTNTVFGDPLQGVVKKCDYLK